MSNVVDLIVRRMSAYSDRKERRIARVAETLAEEEQRLEPIQASAGQFADRLFAGELSKSYVMEIAQFLDVPNEKLAELYLLLDAIDDRR